MESKKRPHAEDAEHSRAKKRAVSDDRSSPSHPNGTTASHGDEPRDGDNIELFRKEAIFRRMKHYSREAERSQARVAELERRFSTCQAGLAALEACWTQLIGTIRSLVKPEDLPSLPIESEGNQDFAHHLPPDTEPEYVKSLQDKMNSTTGIVQAFVTLSTQSQGGPSNEDILRRCQEAESERAILRAELSLMRLRCRDAETQNQRCHEQLLSAEKRADRLQSRSLVPNHVTVNEEPARSPSVENGASSPPQPPLVNGNHAPESDEWRDLANLRESKIEELMRENGELRDQLQEAQLQVKTPSEDFVTQTLYYKILLERASRLEHASQESQTEATKFKEQLDTLNASRSEFEVDMKASQDATISELKQMLTKRDAENARLRELRDQFQSEINERKMKEQTRLASVLEFKALAENRSERIVALESENKRLKARLAANAGDEDLLKFLWQNTSDSTSFVDDLKQRLSAAEERTAALEKTLGSAQSGGRGEAEVRRQLAQVQKQLQKYQAVYGDASSMSSDAARLSEQLQHKQAELEKLKLQDQQREQAESALYSEIEKLSSAWELLDRQVKNKVFDLSALEDRMSKLNTERAKSENRFYQCMRDKDAVDGERKKLALNLEKAAKAIEKLTESERALTTRVIDLEKELVLWKKVGEKHRERGTTLEGELSEWRARALGEHKNVEELRASFAEHSKTVDKKRDELRKLEESLLKTKKDAEKLARLNSSIVAVDPSSKEASLQKECDKLMSILKCSTCQLNFRNTILTKCMHTFCKSCVDARISTRQRKCPACNLAFSAGEVSQVYFQ